ncbi:MAG: threonine-phosphate decarboxylase CobD [Granulosicoccaceae bacterium]
MLHHGGRLSAAAHEYGIPLEHWLDLSTGINLSGWPVPAIPERCWLRLPEDEDELELAARDYYGAPDLLPVAGSQAAIQALPHLRLNSRVAVLNPGYAEHAAAWRAAGHAVEPVAAEAIDAAIDRLDVLVLIHPCNPSGARFTRQQLLSWHRSLAARGGWLVVDEAFMDVTPEHSLAADSQSPGLVVLRSLGKFFGLAGARVGFVCAQRELLQQLREKLGPWTINAPSRWVSTKALRDRAWQQQTRERLLQDEQQMVELLREYQLPPTGGCALFQWHCSEHALALHQALARQAVFTRLFKNPSAIRFGLPATETQWRHLEDALANLQSLIARWY